MIIFKCWIWSSNIYGIGNRLCPNWSRDFALQHLPMLLLLSPHLHLAVEHGLTKQLCKLNKPDLPKMFNFKWIYSDRIGLCLFSIRITKIHWDCVPHLFTLKRHFTFLSINTEHLSTCILTVQRDHGVK